MRNQASRAIFDYWVNIKGDHGAPLRTEVDPTALRHLLPNLFIIAVDLRGTLSFRLAGTLICELFDREFRNAAFAEAWLDGDGRHVAEIVQDVLCSERPALLHVLVSKSQVHKAYEMLLLPLRPVEGDTCGRVLGALLPCEHKFPSTEIPAAGLALEDWTFLTGSGSHFGVPVTADRRILPEALRRLLPRRLSGSQQAS